MSKMRTNTDFKNTDIVSKVKVRESLQLLQPSVMDKEYLVAAGKMLRSINKQIKKVRTKNVTSDKTKSKLSDKSKEETSKDKAIQTASEE
ncbi:PREDICTED: uncharacterized protein LOC106750673 isoform X3 [Dinoponera quadriceps]|uniref:Uncharacterized protein LOC106750673 isoform X3 n=1 Tax=Dinoponera quadriceps TaxID=609295 RepID=A0A6P3Y9H8_DINQU|nr:PREDICTED: uncharacterized protein LOC106750673 isoform X3 [Dinoponera quadriceps]